MQKKELYEFIGVGSYGCVIKPQSGETILKLFNNEEAYIKELEENELIEEFDKEKKFTVELKNSEKLTKTVEIQTVLKTNCDNLFKKSIPDEIFKIEYENGGIDLHELFKEKNIKILEKINIGKFFKNFINIFEGIKTINEKKHTHFDIKHNNIVFNIKTYKFSLIDFGLLVKTEEIYYSDNLLYDEYVFYPPEYTIVSYFYFKDYKKKDKEKYDKDLYNKSIDAMRLKLYPDCSANDKIKGYIKNFFNEFDDIISPTKQLFEELDKIFGNIKQLSDFYSHEDKKIIIKEYLPSDIDDDEKILSKYINDACFNFYKLESDIKSKFDVFMLGNALLYVVIKMCCSEYANLTTIKPEIIKKILDVILKMIHPNPCLRYSSEQAFNAYKDIFHP